MKRDKKLINSKKAILKLLFIIIVIAPLLLFFICAWIPVKYAKKIDDVGEYPGCILVQEAFHTGSGWEQVGNDKGYLSLEAHEDVYLTGNLPGKTDIRVGDDNTYLCVVEYSGYYTLDADYPELIFRRYNVIEWYPIYPVKRNTIFPSWIYPSGYLSKGDFYRSVI